MLLGCSFFVRLFLVRLFGPAGSKALPRCYYVTPLGWRRFTMIYWETAFFLCCQPAMSSEHPRRPVDKLPQQTATTRLTVRSHQCRLDTNNPQTATTSLAVPSRQRWLRQLSASRIGSSVTLADTNKPPNRDHNPSCSLSPALACQRASRTGSSVTLADTNKPSNRDHEPNYSYPSALACQRASRIGSSVTLARSASRGRRCWWCLPGGW